MKRAWHALAAYTVLSLVATWPLARGLGRDVAWDLGDPLFVMWALSWDCEQLLGILRGDFFRVATFFDANIFHPAPLILAYSEHFIAQALQILPVYAATGNPILSYNLLFLSTFALSGLGAYLFVRELTGNPRAAFIAGLLFAFAPYRIPQSSHLQVLSSQWMPFALYGFRRYFDSFVGPAQTRKGRVRPLAGAAAALIAQNLSCGYYLLYFSPFAAAYVLWELANRHAWREWKVWAQLTASAAVILIVTLPFMLPYAAVRQALDLGRSRGEILRYSADVYSYATAYSEQPVWGSRVRAFPKPEGDLFPGLITPLLALVGIVFWREHRGSRQPTPTGIGFASRLPTPAPRRAQGGLSLPKADSRKTQTRDKKTRREVVISITLIAAVLHLSAAAVALLYRRFTVDVWLFELSISNITQVLLRAALLFAGVLVLSRSARTRTAVFMRAQGFFAVALAAAVWLSLGPAPQALGRPLDLIGPYSLLYEYAPGFDGLRVPARFAMIAILMLAVLGGMGAAVLSRWRAAPVLWLALAIAFLAESVTLPFTVNGGTPPRGFNAAEARVYRPSRAPAAYKEVARQPPGTVLAELPLGQPDFDLRALFYSTVHWKPVLNGYSGFFPRHYGLLAVAVSDVPRHVDVAIDALQAAGATHVLVHESAYLEQWGPQTSAALLERGAVELFRDGSDVLLKLP